MCIGNECVNFPNKPKKHNIMISKIQNLQGVQVLNKAQQSQINGGTEACIEVTCVFPDNFNWVGSTNSYTTASNMETHCTNSGGDPQTVDSCLAMR